MEQAYVHLLHLLGGHAGWTLAVVFLAAFLESVAVIGTFIPGSTAMFLAGALVGTGALNLGWLFACALVGAIAGDGLSYWIGHRYRNTLVQLWPFRTHPQILQTGHQYFTQHGARSVVFARFIAPVRAIVPVVAGMLGMSPTRFYAMNALSAVLWAPAHILPGVVFGASLQLAGAVSFRLVAVIAILAAIGWLSFQAMRPIVLRARAWANASRRELVVWARCHNGRAASVLVQVLDPERPAMSIVAIISVLVLLFAGIFFGVFQGVANGDPLVQIDMSVYRFLQSIHSPWADSLVSGLATLGSVPTLAAVVATVIVWMTYERRWLAVAYWLAAVAFSQLLIFAIQLTVRQVSPVSTGFEAYAFPSNHVAASAIVYGFLAFLLSRRVGKNSGRPGNDGQRRDRRGGSVRRALRGTLFVLRCGGRRGVRGDLGRRRCIDRRVAQPWDARSTRVYARCDAAGDLRQRSTANRTSPFGQRTVQRTTPSSRGRHRSAMDRYALEDLCLLPL